MDDSGRLHMPGFVGETFEETGVKHKIDEAARQKIEGADLHNAVELGNRKSRRAMAAHGVADRRQGKQFAR